MKDSLISVERINHSVRKILAAKRWLELKNAEIRNNYAGQIDSIQRSNSGLAWDIAEHSITLVKNDDYIVPLDTSSATRIACITVTDGLKTDKKEIFEKLVSDSFKRTKPYFIDRKSTGRDYSRALRIARSSDIILLPVFMRLRSENDSLMLKYHEKFIKQLLKNRKPVIIISLDDPYLLSVLPSARVYLCSYGSAEVSQKAAFYALTGKINITGKLPISIPNTDFNLGFGLTTRHN